MAIGTPRSFHKKFKFTCEIDNFNFFGFQKCSELSVEIAKIEYFEGGTLIANKSPGRLNVPDVTIERAATNDSDMWNWMKDVADMSAQVGLVDNDYKREADMLQMDRDGSELRRWTLSNVWPNKFVAGEWDNEADENVIEKLTLTLDSFDKTFGF